MSNTLLIPTRNIDPHTVALLTVVDQVARALEVEYFVAGASARDIVLGACFGIDTGEATRDVDFAFALEEWSQFETMKGRLLATGAFEAHRIGHRLTFRGVRLLDLIPFGGIENPPGKIAWPPDFETVMNMQGFLAAFERAVEVEVTLGLVIKFASPDGLMLLKLFAWQDRGREPHSKDARDIALLLRTYLDAGNRERLFSEHGDLLEVEDFDYVRAGTRILGRDLGSWLSGEVRAQLLQILDAGLAEADDHPLARALPMEDGLAMQLLTNLQHGLGDAGSGRPGSRS